MTPTNTEFVAALLALALIAVALLWQLLAIVLIAIALLCLLASVAMWWHRATSSARHAVNGYIDRQAWYDDSHFY